MAPFWEDFGIHFSDAGFQHCNSPSKSEVENMKIRNFHDFPSNSEFPKTMAKCALSWPGQLKTMWPNEMLDRIKVWWASQADQARHQKP